MAKTFSEVAVLTANQSVLAVVRNVRGGIESVTVFVPYSKTRPSWAKSYEWYASRYESHFGPVDIAYSWRSTYLMLGRMQSGFHTGVPLPNEQFSVMSRVDAIKQAENLFKENYGKVRA